MIKFEHWKNAFNKLKCNLGDCVVDENYKDGVLHRFIIENGNLYYGSIESTYWSPKRYEGLASLRVDCACSFLSEIYPVGLNRIEHRN